MTSMRAAAGWVAVLTLAAACAEVPEDSGIRIAGDTTFVHSVEPALGTGTLRELLRIGEVDGADEYMFSRIFMIDVGPRGDIYVATSEGDVRLYDAQGAYVRTIARNGQGPGEVEYVVGMDVAPDGRLAVLDFSNQRIGIYGPEGQLERHIRRPAGRPAYGRDAIQWDDAGELWLAVHPPRSGADTLAAGPRPIYGRLTDDEVVADTVFLPTRAWEGCERRRPGFAAGFFEDGRLPYLPFAHWTRRGDGVVAFGCSAAYSIDVAAPDGTVRRISRSWTPPTMTEEENDFYDFAQNVNTGFDRPTYSVPLERPAFLRLWVADDGRVWSWPGAPGVAEEVSEEQREQVEARSGGRRAPSRFWTYWAETDGLDVFDPEGRWLGHVDTPVGWDGDPFPGLTDPLFRGDTIWAVMKDDLDVRYVVKYVVEWSPSG